MIEKKLTFRQLGIIVLLTTLALKFFALPSLLYEYSANDSFVSAIIILVIDLIMTYLMLVILKRSGESNFYEFVSSCFGKVVAKIYCVLLIALFLIQIALSLEGLNFFVVQNLFAEFEPLRFILPLTLVVGYLVFTGDYNIAKTAEVFIWFIIIGVLLILLSSAGNADVTFFLPAFKDGFTPVLKSIYIHITWYGSFNVLLLFFGRVNLNDKGMKKFNFYIIVTAIIYLLNFFIFYSLFTITSSQHNYAISDISQISSGAGTLDELAWFVVIIWLIAQVLQIAVYSNATMKTISMCFKCNKSISTLIVCIYLVVCVIVSEEVAQLRNIFDKGNLQPFVIAVAYVLPLCLFIASTIKVNMKKENKYGKSKNKKNI